MEENITYGIDLGTTFSAVCYVPPNGGPNFVRLGQKGEVSLPSAVLFLEGDKVQVGEKAIENSWKAGSKLVEFAKRDIGLQGGRTWNYGGWTYEPEEISALILRKIMKEMKADSMLAPIRKVVITYPQNFGIMQKQLTKEACELAGLDVVATVTEPNAAAIAYGVYEQSRESQSEKTILVFDLGGGTFDVTLMRVGPEKFDMPNSAGDPQLGGIDWDAEIVQMAKREYSLRCNANFDDVATDQEKLGLRKEATQTKELLSDPDQDMYRMKVQANGAVLPVDIRRDDFEQRCAQLVARCLDKCEDVLRDANCGWGELDEILLVGSSSKMPMIREAIRRRSTRQPRIDREPKLMVSKGAALLGHWISIGKFDPKLIEGGAKRAGLKVSGNLQIHGCTPHGLGVRVEDDDGRDIVRALIPGGTQTPCEMEGTFYTVEENQTTIWVDLYEGDSERLSDCKQIGQVCVDGLPRRQKDQPVEVKFGIDHSGLLNVEVTDLRTGKRQIKRIDRRALRADANEKEVDFDTRKRHLSEIVVL
jgi:molecular chaperone DnaK